ncbi:hypothetical protein GCM10028806_03860 [Spirosoma terrae]
MFVVKLMLPFDPLQVPGLAGVPRTRVGGVGSVRGTLDALEAEQTALLMVKAE